MSETSNACSDRRVNELCLFAWVGEDELGSGEVGIKQGLVPAGCVPLVSVDEGKMGALKEQLQSQADRYGKTIRLCRFSFKDEILCCNPQP